MDFDKFARLEITSSAALWDWLGAHHAQTASVWLVTYKAKDRAKYVSRDAVLDALIAHGWIDGRRLRLDDTRTMQLISSRKQLLGRKAIKIAQPAFWPSGRCTPQVWPR